MADVVRETERKYRAADGAELPGLKVKGVASVTDRGRDRLHAVYYDTPGGALAADGITLRRRTGGPDAGWHLKLPVAPHVRDEIREPPADEPPRSLTALVRSRVRSEPLVPVMDLLSERDVRQLCAEDGTVLAEVSLDRVQAARPDGATAAWTEAEAELAAGPPALLDRIGKRLRKAGMQPSQAPSKLQRALDETTPAPGAPAPGAAAGPPDDTAGAHVLGYVRTQVRALVALDPAVRRDLPDAVHRMRVASRRLRSCFRSYRAVLDPRVTEPIGAELRRLAAELGRDRDREVLLERLTARVAELPRTLRLGPVSRRLHTHDRALRSGTRSRITAVLDGRRHLALLDALDALLADPPLLPKAAKPAETVLPSVIRQENRRLEARVTAALAAPAGQQRDDALHEARKAAKRARYATEAAGRALGARAARHGRPLTAVQTVLGEHQDSVQARRALRDIAVQAHAAGEQSFTYGVLHAREEALADRHERELPGLWSAVSATVP
ncbi:MAG TPA: CYTH and CHAD domain-containing protein [Streptomyces sp.]|nr:CYTH and CHAD domain-containing protein [Streptomyces sp.]